MRIVDADNARAFIDDLDVQTEPEDGEKLTGGPFLNLAFTCRGLANIGVPKADLAHFPQEFREGMEERAGLLGDLRDSHPRNWTLPDRNWPGRAAAGRARIAGRHVRDRPRHPVADHRPHMRVRTSSATRRIRCMTKWRGSARIPTFPAFACSPSSRCAAPTPSSTNFGREHFGFRDGFSQPKAVRWLRPAPAGRGRARRAAAGLCERPVRPRAAGECAHGQRHLPGRAQAQPGCRRAEGVRRRTRRRSAAKESLYANMMGRTRAGDVRRARRHRATTFDYAPDPDGQKCPFQAHTRRTNPRPSQADRRRPADAAHPAARPVLRTLASGRRGGCAQDRPRGRLHGL